MLPFGIWKVLEGGPTLAMKSFMLRPSQARSFASNAPWVAQPSISTTAANAITVASDLRMTPPFSRDHGITLSKDALGLPKAALITATPAARLGLSGTRKS